MKRNFRGFTFKEAEEKGRKINKNLEEECENIRQGIRDRG